MFEIYIKTTPERLWEAITDSEMSRKYWFGIGVTSDWKPGSRYERLHPLALEGENLEVDPGRRLVQTVSGGLLGAAFMEHDLIDEYRIYVHPIVIGRGKPLFRPSAQRIALRLGETRTFGNGVVLLRYERPGGGGRN